jgi:hypothetical protein
VQALVKQGDLNRPHYFEQMAQTRAVGLSMEANIQGLFDLPRKAAAEFSHGQNRSAGPKPHGIPNMMKVPDAGREVLGGTAVPKSAAFLSQSNFPYSA